MWPYTRVYTHVDNLNLEELVEDDDNDNGDPSNQYEARSKEPNENREFNNEADVGVFN